MIAAYPIGYGFEHDSVGIRVCRDATQTACFVTWNAVGPDVAVSYDTSTSVCVNPLSWRNDDSIVGHDANAGAYIGLGKFEAGVADARCVNGQLELSEIRSDNFRARPLGRDNYHICDYSLFYKNLQDNVAARIAAFNSISRILRKPRRKNSSRISAENSATGRTASMYPPTNHCAVCANKRGTSVSQIPSGTHDPRLPST